MTSAADTWPASPGWRDFFDLLCDAVIVFDQRARVVLREHRRAARCCRARPARRCISCGGVLGS